MKQLLLTLASVCLVQFAFAQFGGFGGGGSTIKGKITGQVIDSLSKDGVEFASIVLINEKNDKEVDGLITDSDGSFKLSEVELGTYKIVISFLGYETKTLSGIELTKREPDAALEEVSLEKTNVLLDEVTVTEEASLIENKIDKIVYNAEKDVANVGGDATDVLRRVPLLSVDLEGNVSLRGSQNLQILINGRPSGMFANSVADALKTIPADQIKSVEVITTPTAKYDAEGSAGIINIITKKKSAEGFTGSINASIGNVNNNASGSFSAAKGRFGINASGGSYFSWFRPSMFSLYREDSFGTGTRIFQQEGDGESNFVGFNGSVNAFYDLNAFNSVSTTFRLNGRRFVRRGDNDISFSDEMNSFVQEYTSNYDESSLYSGFDWVTDYRMEFEEGSDQEFSAAFQITGNIDDRENDLMQMSMLEFLDIDQSLTNNGLNVEYTGQIDYVHPFNDNFKLEGGIKTIIRRIEADYDAFDNEANSIIDNPFLTNIFNYNQDVYAGYLSANIKMGKFGAVIGSRYEYTGISGNYSLENPSFENDYFNILPSIIISRNFKNFQTLKLGYTRRIQRPSLFFINPYSSQNDNRTLTFGNPLLDPEITDQVEFSYNTFIKGVGLNGSLFYRNNTDVIETFLQDVTQQGVSETTFRNIGENNSIGFNFFSNATIKRIWTIRGGFNIFSYDATAVIDGQRLSNRALQGNGFGSTDLKFKSGFKIEAFGFYRAPQQNIQGVTPAFSIWGMGAQQDILGKKGSVGIRVIEPFAKFKTFGTDLSGPNFEFVSDYSILFRSFGVSFQYRFGELTFKQRERRSKIRNSDLKNGDGGGGQQGGGGQGPG
ncbi:MAG: TonB-dependent receptor [Bacteroidota bacterium]